MIGKCYECGEPGAKLWNNAPLCKKHYRFMQMVRSAKLAKKRVPLRAELNQLAKSMTCPDCGRTMNWLMSEGTSTVLCLQHCRDGSIAFVCKGCNSAHGQWPGDAYRDLPRDLKMCLGCNQALPLSKFAPDASRRNGVRPYCHECTRAKGREYYARKRVA